MSEGVHGRRGRAFVVLLALAAITALVFWWRRAPGPLHPASNAPGATPGKNAPPSEPATPAFMYPPTADPGGLEGIVVDGADAPIAGAVVTVAPRFVGNDQFEAAFGSVNLPTARTDASGRFRFDDVRPGVLAVTATAARFIPGRLEPVNLEPGKRITDLKLKLSAGGVRLYGTVVDSGGGAIAGAQVAAIAVVPPDDSDGPSADTADGKRSFSINLLQALTGDDGTYELWLKPDSYSLRAAADGYASEYAWADVKTEARVAFRLNAAARITGKVVLKREREGAASDEPVADATVTVTTTEAWSWAPLARITTGANGRFASGGLDPAKYLVSARKESLVGRLAESVGVALAQTVDVTVEVKPGFSISGRITDAKGAPVADAKVITHANAFDQREGGPKDTSTADGKYQLNGLLAGSTYLKVSVDGHAEESRTLVLVDRSLSNVDFKLRKQARVRVLVLGEGDRPVSGASAHIFLGAMDGSSDFQVRFTEKPTGADGRLVLDRLRSGPAQLQVEAREQRGNATEKFDLKEGEDKEITIKLKTFGRVSGHVRWDDGTPAASVAVLAFGPNSNANATTDRDGKYTVDKLAAGTINLVARMSQTDNFERRPYHKSVKEVTLAAGQTLEGVDLEMRKRDKSISGQVLGPDGRGMGGIAVGTMDNSNGRGGWGDCSEALQAKLFSEPDGRFTIGGLREGLFAVCAKHPEFPDVMRLNVPAPSEGVTLQLEAAGAISGALVDGKGKPVSGYLLLAFFRRDMDLAPPYAPIKGRPREQKMITDPAGAFLIKSLEKGSYDLMAVLPDRARATAFNVAVAAGKETAGVQLVLKPTVTVTGRVLTAEDGAPRAGVTVSPLLEFIENMVGPMPPVKTGTDGRFRLPGAPPGTQYGVTFNPGNESLQGDFRDLWIPASAAEFDIGDVKLVQAMKSADPWGTGPSVGLNIHHRGGSLMVTSLMPDSPAVSSGIKMGDRVLAIDGKPTTDMGANLVRNVLSGEDGSSVVVRVQTGTDQPRDVTMRRARY